MLGQIAKQLRLVTRGSEVTWRYGYHLPDVLKYRLQRPRTPSGEVRRVVEELNQNGVARTSVGALLASDSVYQELRREVDDVQRVRAEDLTKARAAGVLGAHKTYSYEFFDGHPKPGTVHTRFASQPEIKQVADQYLGLNARLRGCNTWLTLVTNAEARQSQTWHRDPEDRYVVKIFTLLSEVDKGCGPFQYAPGSHMKSSNAGLKAFTKYGLSDDEMDTLVPRKQWFLGTGEPGTIIFADTRGYHKGGLARERERLVFVGMYLAF
ncbi:MAG: phytanoyl-CoA dioxygenase family protein [Acidobacteriota bacterium]